MKKILFFCLLLSVFTYATVYTFEVDGCKVKFNTFTKDFKATDKCYYAVKFNEKWTEHYVDMWCEVNPNFKKWEDVDRFTLLYVKGRNEFIFGADKKLLEDYTINDFAVDLNSGVFFRCHLSKRMTITSNDK